MTKMSNNPNKIINHSFKIKIIFSIIITMKMKSLQINYRIITLKNPDLYQMSRKIEM